MTWLRDLERALRVDHAGVRWLDAPIDDPTIERLTTHLYKCFYCPGRPIVANRASDLLAGLSGEFDETCARAFGSFPLIGGEVEDGARLGGVRWVVDRGKRPMRARATRLSPGFLLFAHGGILEAEEPPVIRLYLNLVPAGVVELLASLRELDCAAFHSVKVLRAPMSKTRADVAVVYLRSIAEEDTRTVIDRCVSVTHGLRRPHIPTMTFELNSGAAVAVGPPGGESFGLHRCRLLALAVRAAMGERQASLERLVSCAFAEQGLDAARPSASVSDKPCLPTGGARRASQARSISSHTILDDIRHGSLLLEGQRTWYSSVDGVTRPVDASVYSGHAGIALALAAAVRAGYRGAEDDARFAGAMALRLAGYMPHDGLHHGRAGVLGAVALARTLLGDPVAQDDWKQIAFDFAQNYAPTGSAADLFRGVAGTVIALGPAFAHEERLRLARDDALRQMLAAAESLDADRAQPGLAHGVAGLQAALASHAVPRVKLRLAELEDQWFDPERQDWPHADEALEPSHWTCGPAAWCHGRGGIVLARQAAGAPLPAAWDPNEHPPEDAMLDGSLCHGLAGAAAVDLLLSSDARANCQRRLADAHRMLTPRQGWWPAPGLFDGRAGILLAALAAEGHVHALRALAWTLAVPALPYTGWDETRPEPARLAP